MIIKETKFKIHEKLKNSNIPNLKNIQVTKILIMKYLIHSVSALIIH
jgi:hypothetical protein